MERNKRIIQTSYIGIGVNILLASFKAIIGIVTNSIAIVLDGVNNLSDALSSLITIVGAKLSQKDPDKKHPYGHGRIEYLSATLIAIIVFYAGISSLSAAIRKTLNPEVPNYTVRSIIIIGVAVIAKILLGTYYKKVGKEVSSDSLIDSGQDALMDSVLSFSTVVAAILFYFTNVSIEAYLALFISLFIIKTGYDMLKNTISKLLGERIDNTLAVRIKQSITEDPDVFGAYDLSLNDYGPERLVGSVHVEVPDHFTANDIDSLTRRIQHKILEEFGVAISAVGIYTHNPAHTEDEVIIRKIVFENPDIIQMHGFYLDKDNKTMNFDLVVDFKIDWESTKARIIERILELYPGYKIEIVKDIDMSD